MSTKRRRQASGTARDDQVGQLALVLGLDLDATLRAVDRYNVDFSAYGNEVYEQVETRVAHWSNFIEGGWFQHRFDRALEMAEDVDLVVDLGFSVPYAYARERFRRRAKPRFLYVDRDPSCVAFYGAIVGLLDLERLRARDRVIPADVTSEVGAHTVLEAARALSPKRVLVVAAEVIEHIDDEQACWRLLGHLERLPTVERGRVYVTLPIGRRIPSHQLEFRSVPAAVEYLESRMKIDSIDVLRPGDGDERTPFLEACICAVGHVENS